MSLKLTYGELTPGQRIELPVHYDLWARGARFGTVRRYHAGQPGRSAYFTVKSDHPQVRKLVKVWALDWDYCKRID